MKTSKLLSQLCLNAHISMSSIAIFLLVGLSFSSAANNLETVTSNAKTGLQPTNQITVKPPLRTFFLVRHGEKLSGENPDLSEQGRNRALALANTLSAVELELVFSTEYTRTQQTALPTAKSQHLSIKSYNPRELANFAKHLLTNPSKSVLIVGHSNTTPQLVELLGGEPGSEINEKSEFDRLYIVTVISSEIDSSTPSLTTTTLLKY